MQQELTVYVSYHVNDRLWKARLVKELRDLQADGTLGNWDIVESDPIGAGEDSSQAINQAIDFSQAAILLISKSYMTSSFVQKEELPRLFERSRTDNLLILPVLVGSSDWLKDTRFSTPIVLPEDRRPLDEREQEDAERELRSIARDIAEALRQAESSLLPREPLPREPAPPSSEQEGDKPPLDSDLVSLEEIDRLFRLSSSSKEVMARARKLAEGLSAPVPAVTSSLLLFAMIEEGRSRGASGSPRFLWNYIVERGGEADYEGVRSRYLRSHGVRDDAVERASKAEGETVYDVDLPQYAARDTLAVLEQAWILR